MNNRFSELAAADLNDLRVAKSKLEYPGLTARITALIGKPIETGFKLLPRNWNEKITDITQAVLLKGLETAVRTMGGIKTKSSRDWLHRILVASSGVGRCSAFRVSIRYEAPERIANASSGINRRRGNRDRD
jgi:hypothetical protein